MSQGRVADIEAEIVGLFGDQITQSQLALRSSIANLPPLAAHVTNAYKGSLADNAARKQAFHDAKV